MNINRGIMQRPIKGVLYGPEGIGKSTFASRFPDPLFIDTEDSTIHMDVARFDKPTSWEMLLQQVDYVIMRRPCKTLVIDTIDWAELLCKRHVLDKNGWKSIEEPGYGKGFTVLSEEMARLLNRLSDVVEAGINVVLTAHAMMRKFEKPDEMGSYDRWELKLEKKISPLVKEWSDLLLFANYNIVLVTDSKTKSKKAQGGQRVMYTTHNPAWDAKNRFGMPEIMPFDFESIAPIFNGAAVPIPEPMPEPMPESDLIIECDPNAPIAVTQEARPVVEAPAEVVEAVEPLADKRIVDLLLANGFTLNDLEAAAGPTTGGGLGFMPAGMTVAQYPQGFPDYIVANWQTFYEQMDKNRVPFDL